MHDIWLGLQHYFSFNFGELSIIFSDLLVISFDLLNLSAKILLTSFVKAIWLDWDFDKSLWLADANLGYCLEDDIDDLLTENKILLHIHHESETKVSDVRLILDILKHHIDSCWCSWRDFLKSLVKSEDNRRVLECAIISAQELHEVALNGFSSELEAFILRLSKNEVKEASKCEDHLSNETTNDNDSIIGRIVIFHIIDLQLWGVLFKVGNLDDLVLDDFLQLLKSMLLSQSGSLLFSLFLGFLKFSLLFDFGFLFLLSLVELLNDGLFVLV